MVSYLSITKKPQKLDPEPFCQLHFGLKAHIFLQLARRCRLTDIFGHEAKNGLNTENKV